MTSYTAEAINLRVLTLPMSNWMNWKRPTIKLKHSFDVVQPQLRRANILYDQHVEDHYAVRSVEGLSPETPFLFFKSPFSKKSFYGGNLALLNSLGMSNFRETSNDLRLQPEGWITIILQM